MYEVTRVFPDTVPPLPNILPLFIPPPFFFANTPFSSRRPEFFTSTHRVRWGPFLPVNSDGLIELRLPRSPFSRNRPPYCSDERNALLPCFSSASFFFFTLNTALGDDFLSPRGRIIHVVYR